jgi:hypothetical protein
MRKKLCKIVIVVIVFGRINILLGLDTLTEANQTNAKKKERGGYLSTKCQKSGSLYTYDAIYIFYIIVDIM